jgi:pimeloyl-ACP methyl ester carboxylesterase
VLANDAEHDDYAAIFPEAIPRIDAALTYLQAQGNQKIVLVAHSLGSLMTSFYLSKKHPDLVKGFVAIGMSGGAKHAVMDSLQTLKSVKVPVLDLFGSDDLPEVLAHRQTRPQAAASQNYQQLEVQGANHFFDGHNEALVNAVSNWVGKLP